MLLNVAVGVLLAVAHLATAQIANRKPASLGYKYRHACLASCTLSGPSLSNWSDYHSLEGVYGCPQALFCGFNVRGPWTMARPRTAFALVLRAGRRIHMLSLIGLRGCGTDTPDAASAIILLRQLRHYLNQDSTVVEDRAMLFAHFNAVSFGVYVGHGRNSQGVGSSALKALESSLDRQGTTRGSFLALRPKVGHPIQAALKDWAAAKCMTSAQSKTSEGSARFSTPLTPLHNGSSNGTVGAIQNNTSLHRVEHDRALLRRDECRTVQVARGDTCASLAQKCGISGPDFTKYNLDSNLCSSLMPLQHVCCSSGTLPDFRPKPNGDGSCATYQIRKNDTCSSLAAANGLTLDELDGFNKNTWSWNGCDLVWVQAIICLSSGAPPMPASLANAVCGPQVPGTQRSSDVTDISSLNPCPLNACCDIWGQCGVTEEFCIDTNTGAPGTARKGTNGCISNCGTNIVHSDAPATFRRIGYFEGYRFSSRKCLYEEALQVDGSQYTHLHFAFATLSPSFEVSTGDLMTTYEFQNFRRLSGAKRILSFGGWDFSTGPGTYTIFCDGVTEANRQKLAANIAKFVYDWNLDGVDIDWEYPGTPDIPNIPPGSKEDGMNYLKFLIQLRILLKGKFLSIAAPASYWYLKGFPIKQITGLPKWNVLKECGVNLTETISSLVMVTRAGVPSNKVVVCITSYGRSFAMAEAGCHGPDCAYTGTPIHSDATEGRCTGTVGYIADAEIHEILNDTSRVTTAYIDAASNTNILVYDNTQWVSYMGRGIQTQRTALYKALRMGGTTNWAIDLETFEDVPVGDSWANFGLRVKSGLDPCQQGKRNGNWTELTCTDRSVEDNSLTPKQRWDQT
ncbi:hypothetical protein NLG97_g8492 [Lecanicillium saksenae]|uniref:Uncharacterized protein n=1 Tax=Lecanicillium saksenae TaxID=468837 RepID=A0ACC1QLE4_9HYPO|nr:hypothetical protein NLG97_g8492 [Lecanicillium saksenae]